MVDPDSDADPVGLRLCLGIPTRSDLGWALRTLAGHATGEGDGTSAAV